MLGDVGDRCREPARLEAGRVIIKADLVAAIVALDDVQVSDGRQRTCDGVGHDAHPKAASAARTGTAEARWDFRWDFSPTKPGLSRTMITFCAAAGTPRKRRSA